MIVTPDDVRYDDLTRGFNQRWVSRPEYINVARSAQDVQRAVQDMDANSPQAQQLLKDFIAAVADGVGVAPQPREDRKLPWWHATHWPGLFGDDPTGRAESFTATCSPTPAASRCRTT